MTAVRISGTFKKDERPGNGLEAIAATLVKDELSRHVVVGIVELHKVTKEPGEAPVPTVKFTAIEPLSDDQADEARLLLNSARRKRGESEIPGTLFDGDEPRELLELEEKRAAAREAAEARGDEHGATLDFADQLHEINQELGTSPLVCAVCGREIHFDPAKDSYVDGEGWADGAEDGGHPHVPAERAPVGSEAR